ncbi:LysR family transcriptional regulator [Paraferrimonas sedimenticola]|uniref:LysR family transcriptional regulator n=1 Tax=Paraferrimonas sedimenticola TaxID=375674 RepID=A0AA37RYC7_9GAMM|nr:LysR family transcriptional regulator [Paraferrimonas sedimenticola]GLP97605.1 LysR family transcriptional regulator [Paraferrimonas sedimenticola]
MASIDQLKILKAVSECTSLAQAAEVVHKSQPALTNALKQLETQLGIELFDRSGYRLQLSDSGQAIARKARQLLEHHAQLIDAARAFGQGEEKQVTIAIEASFPIHTIAKQLQTVQHQHPHTRVVLHQEYLSGAFERLSNQSVDLAITPVHPQLTHQVPVSSHCIGQGRMVNVASPDLLARHPKLESVRQLINDNQIVVQDSGSMTAGHELDVSSDQRRWYVNDFASKLSLILAGAGWGRLPMHLINSHLDGGQLQVIETQDMASEIQLDYQLVRLSRHTPGPVAKKLWQLLTEIPSKHQSD